MLDEGSAVALAALIAVLAQSFFTALEARRRRVERAKIMTASARLVRDELSGNMEALHHSISKGVWWPRELDSEPAVTDEDRRMLAANANAETLRRSFGSLRRYRQLRILRARISAEEGPSELDHDQLVEVVAVFLDLATARRLLSEFTGYGSAPFGRAVHIPPAVLAEALAAAAIHSADGLYRDPGAVS